MSILLSKDISFILIFVPTATALVKSLSHFYYNIVFKKKSGLHFKPSSICLLFIVSDFPKWGVLIMTYLCSKIFDASSLSTKSKLLTKTIKALNSLPNLVHDPGSIATFINPLVSECMMDSMTTLPLLVVFPLSGLFFLLPHFFLSKSYVSFKS